MNQKLREKVIELTQQVLEEYWHGNQKLLIEYLDKDIMWIGAVDREYIRGKDNMLKHIKANQKEMPKVRLARQTYEIASCDSRSCVVAGRYTAYTEKNSGMLLQEKQRVTFVWKVQEKELKITHIHLSNILHIQDEEEHFPVRAGKETYDYVQRILAEKEQESQIVIKDNTGITRVIRYDDILYLQANRNYTIMFCEDSNREIKIRQSISVIAEQLPEYFVLMSRSVVVNTYAIRRIRGTEVFLKDGTVLTIPVRKNAEVRQKLLIGREEC